MSRNKRRKTKGKDDVPKSGKKQMYMIEKLRAERKSK